jgi:hypothetical protein
MHLPGVVVPSWRANADAMHADDRRLVIMFLLKQAKRKEEKSLVCGKMVG